MADTEPDVEEVSSDVLTETAYRCIECFDVFPAEEIEKKGNLDTCPTCGEESLMEA